MTRAILENLFLFLLPSFLYFGWQLVIHKKNLKDKPNKSSEILRIVNNAPFFWLGTAGAFLMIIVLISFGSSSGGKPGQHYQPPIYKDGQIIPGNIE